MSIRPPAVEAFLAEEMLHVALHKLSGDTAPDRPGVDVILYLGDAANSGGADEIDTVLGILAEHRRRTGTPIFILIGNHDYLGAGNIVSPGIRFAMLNQIGRPDNPALTKYAVLKRFSEFNHANNQLSGNTGFRYQDNLAQLEKNSHLDHGAGLYLAGVVDYANGRNAPVQIFMMDSSDYKDSPNWSQVVNLGFYGIIGSVSFKDEPDFVSQCTYFKQFARAPGPDYRFLASHYPKDHLDRVTFAKPGEVPLNVTNLAWGLTETAFSVPTFSKTLNQNLEPLLLRNGGNYWLSGHTHVTSMPRAERLVVGGLTMEKYFNAVNVGSATDYRAHVAIIERYEPKKNYRLDRAVGYREIPLFDFDRSLAMSIIEAIREYGRRHADDQDFRPFIPAYQDWIRMTQSGGLLGLLGPFKKDSAAAQPDRYWVDAGATVLGLNKRYQDDGWTDAQTQAAAAHVRQFVDQFVTRTASDRKHVLAFLGLLAGAYECGLLPGKCDFTPESIQKLCLIPK